MTRGRVIFGVLALLILILAADIYVEVHYPVLTAVSLQSEKLPEDFSLKILQISDLHDKSFGRDESLLLKLVEKADPDITVVTGDLADYRTTDFTNIYSFISNLETRTQDIYYVPGNHEQSRPAMKELFDGLSVMGVKMLMDSGMVYKKENTTVNICGINFPFKETSYESGPAAEKKALAKALKGVDTGNYTVLLSHSPGIADSIDGRPFDLVLSGHTHGGQVRLPFIGSVFRLNPDFFSKYDKGLFKMDSGAELYVDSGLGTSIIPVRFCDRADVTLITINGGRKV